LTTVERFFKAVSGIHVRVAPPEDRGIDVPRVPQVLRGRLTALAPSRELSRATALRKSLFHRVLRNTRVASPGFLIR
jgi:hypothetical protein